MSNRWLRFGIALLAIGAAAAAGFRIFQQNQRLFVTRADTDAVDKAAETAIVTISELKAAMHAYVAEGQGHAFWTARAATLIDRLRSSVLELEAPATAAGGTLTESLDLIDRVAAAEARARGHVRDGQRLMAGDVIFTDARDLLDGMRLQILAARTAVANQALAVESSVRREQFMLALAAGGILAFATLLLVIPGASSSASVPAPASSTRTGAMELDELDSSARVVSRTPLPPKPADAPLAAPRSTSGTRTPVASSPSAAGAAAASAAPGSRVASGAPAAPDTPAASPVSIAEAAAVCTELGRVSQSIEISTLLERAAKVLNAAGVIVWMATPDRHEIYPAASAGYDERLLLRIGHIKRDAANVTAAALRDGSARTNPRAGSSAAALAVPLMTPLGPVGVFSAEIRDVGAVDETRLAIATIFAAQLATLLGTMSAASESAAPGGSAHVKAQA